MSKNPPRIATSILKCVLPPKDRVYLLGDYEESFQRKLKEKGALSASLWYWGHLIHAAPEYLLESSYWRFVMFNNYFKIASRNIVRQKLNSAINILGLAIGLACCIWISLYVINEVTYDAFHSNLDSIHRIKRINNENIKTDLDLINSLSSAVNSGKSLQQVLLILSKKMKR